ncbi:hypothetical protein D3C78_1546260 [compost metagenome]
MLASTDIVAQLDVAIRPVVDLLDQPLVNGGKDLVGLPLQTNLRLLVVLGHQMLRGMMQSQRFEVLGDPGRVEYITDQL